MVCVCVQNVNNKFGVREFIDARGKPDPIDHPRGVTACESTGLGGGGQKVIALV